MRLSVQVKILVSLAVLGSAAGIAGLATFASFTSSTPAQSQNLTSGTVSIALGSTNTLTVGASSLVPGDSLQRLVDVGNDGSAVTSSVGQITLTTSASPSSALDTDTTNGLQMAIDDCSQAWTQAGGNAYTCGGTQTAVLPSRPVIGSNLALSNMTAVTAGDTDHLRITLSLPSSAPNSLQGQSSTLDYVFTAEQRAGTTR